MVRRSSKPSDIADAYFPVRVRVATPRPHGFGHQLNVMYGWLDQHAGKDAYYIGSEAGPGLHDAVLLYFLDAKMAAAFVERFACGLIIGRQHPGSTLPG